MRLTSFIIAACILAGALKSTALAEAPQEPFRPNYVAHEDVRLTSGGGKPALTLKKGTLVAAKPARDSLSVRTEKGQSGTASARSFTRLGSSIPVTDATKAAAESSNQFAFDLYAQARSRDGDLFFSPMSISSALGMALAGAAGETQQGMAAVLHVKPGEATHEGFGTLSALLNSAGERSGYTLRSANRLWGASNYRFKDAFLKLTRDTYGAETRELDFSMPEKSRDTINQWVEDQTRGKIIGLIAPGILTPETRLVLTNAIYFEGGWTHEFWESATKEAPFHRTAKDTVSVLTMHQQQDFAYTEDDDAQVLSLPYGEYELSMVVVLPKEIEGLAKLEKDLDHERFSSWIKGLRSDRPVEVYLPKFAMRSHFLLADALKELGMASAFSNQANFSGMSSGESLMISEVIHQAFVDVDEKGTEAAAATAVVLAPAAAVEPEEPPKPVVFWADHPFLFMIRDNRTGAILFMGRVVDPQT